MQASLRAGRFWEQTAAAFSVQSVEDWFSHPLLVSSLQLQLAVQNESVRAFMATLKAASESTIVASKLEFSSTGILTP